ncbi:MAG TPA: hypothetical protein VGY97_11920, partial [Solirubrobacteraceae bacterium]|nr:hypothetical protein [Solirubrobacteraceae bacterium]
MRVLRRWPLALAVGALVVSPAAFALLPSSARSDAGSLQRRLAGKRAAERALSRAVRSENQRIASLSGSIGSLERRLAPIQAQLDAKQAQLRVTQTQLGAARAHLAALQQQLAAADQALTQLLISRYESDSPDAVTVILNSRGFADLLEKLDFLKRIRDQDAHIIENDRALRTVVSAQATRLGALEVREHTLGDSILSPRNQLAAIRLALVR